MKEVKLGFESKDDNDLVDDPKPMKRLSLFACSKEEQKGEENNTISSDDDSDYQEDKFKQPSLNSPLSFSFPRKFDL